MKKLLLPALLSVALPIGAQEWNAASPSYSSPAYEATAATFGGYAPAAEEDAYPASYDMGLDPVYSTPDSAPASYESRRAFIPCDVYFERIGKMRLHGGRGHLSLTHLFVCLPLNDPGRHTWMGWSWDAKLSLRQTWLNGRGASVLDENQLSTVSLHTSLSHAVGQHSRVQLGVAPGYSSDFDQMSAHDVYWGGYAAWNCRFSDALSASLGVAVMPEYYEHHVLPLLNFCYRLPSQWEIALDASRLSCCFARWESLKIGPFVQWNQAAWTVRRHQRTEQLRMSDVILGLGAEGSVPVMQAKLSYLGDIGAAVHNDFRAKDKCGNHTLEKYRARPGLYVRAGLRLAF